jgi:hypothetical protein
VPEAESVSVLRQLLRTRADSRVLPEKRKKNERKKKKKKESISHWPGPMNRNIF